MKNFIKANLLTLMLVFTTTGCGPQAYLIDVPNQSISKKMTQDSMYKAISRASTAKNWEVYKVSNGIIDITKVGKGWTVTSTIQYSERTFNIKLKSSSGLKYDKNSNKIHRNYNKWVDNLKKQIKLEIDLS